MSQAVDNDTLDILNSQGGFSNVLYRNPGTAQRVRDELQCTHRVVQSYSSDYDFISNRYQSSAVDRMEEVETDDDEVMAHSERKARDKVMLPSDCLAKNDTMVFDARLEGAMPYDDGSIAFGTIFLYEDTETSNSNGITYIRGRFSDDLYPNILIKAGLGKKWIRLDGLSIGTRSGMTSLRIYLLPEDVDRSTRGNVKDFRRMVKYLLNFVDCSSAAWQGKMDPHDPINVYNEPVLVQQESLFYIFNTLQSPQPDMSSYKGGIPGLQAMADVLEDNVTGLKTQLYPYQKRSVAAMVKKEADPAKIRDPRKHKMLDIYGQSFFLDFNDGALYRSQPLYHEPRGGVLAETMGYGKTLICLALIMATRGHYPSIPHYCTETYAADIHPKTASLLSMAARKLKYSGLPWKNEFYALKKAGYYYDRCIEELKLYERQYNEPVAGAMNPSRKGKQEYTNIVRLCSSTLVIVPPNLMIQWQQEIGKHVDNDAIDVLVVDAANVPVPAWEELIKYDIILMSKSRFEQEYRDDDLNQGKGIRYAGKYKSPLTEVRWLRVICDEGHGFAGSATKTNAMAMLDKMFIERRWVVSGTPSSTLHGVEIGMASQQSETSGSRHMRRESFGTVLKDRRTPSVQNSEMKDLERLRLIVVNFLKLQPWANKKGVDQADWKTYLAPRLTDDGHCCSLPALREVMQTLIIRHRIQDVDCDLTLPPLSIKLTYLAPTYYDKLSINLFIMILTSNYVTSEREDEDYMFHPRNRGKLTTLINNLGHATFYWIGITSQNVKDTIHVSSAYLDKNIDKITDEDGMLLTEAIMVGEKALSDSGWLAFNSLHEMGTYVSHFPSSAQKAWSLDGNASEPLLMGTTQARGVQKHVHTRFAKDPARALSYLQHHGNKTMNSAREKAEEEQKQLQKQKIGTDQKDVGIREAPSKRAPTTSSSPAKGVYHSSYQTPGEENELRIVKRGSSSSTSNDSQLPDSQIIGFASAKLTYLCTKILSHPDEKSIIFYNHNNTAFFIAEALELLHIPFLIYANTLSVRQRAEYLAKFNTDSDTKVLLMDLKQASQGLHVAAASRVYIVSPIWDQAMESQAIKRAHRIGQRREVVVETLILKGTFEEDLIKRRKQRADDVNSTDPGGHQSKKSASKKSKGAPGNPMLDDYVMVKVLKNIKFLKLDHEDENRKWVRLSPPIPLFKADESSNVGRDEIAPDLSSDKTSPPSIHPSFTGNSQFHSQDSAPLPSANRSALDIPCPISECTEPISMRKTSITTPSIFGYQITHHTETTSETAQSASNCDFNIPGHSVYSTSGNLPNSTPPTFTSSSVFSNLNSESIASTSSSKRKNEQRDAQFDNNSNGQKTDDGAAGDGLSASLAKRLKVGPDPDSP